MHALSELRNVSYVQTNPFHFCTTVCGVYSVEEINIDYSDRYPFAEHIHLDEGRGTPYLLARLSRQGAESRQPCFLPS